MFSPSPALIAVTSLESPWDIVGLVAAIVIVLVPLVGVIAVYFKLGKRPPHKPVEMMPLSEHDRRAELSP